MANIDFVAILKSATSDMYTYHAIDDHEKSVLDFIFDEYICININIKNAYNKIDLEKWRSSMRELNVTLSVDRIDHIYKEMGYGIGSIDQKDHRLFCTRQYDTKELQTIQQAYLAAIKRVKSVRDELLVVGYIRSLLKIDLPPDEILMLIQNWYHIKIFNRYNWEIYKENAMTQVVVSNE